MTHDPYLVAVGTGLFLAIPTFMYALFIGDDRMIDEIRRAWNEGESTSLSYESSES